MIWIIVTLIILCSIIGGMFLYFLLINNKQDNERVVEDTTIDEETINIPEEEWIWESKKCEDGKRGEICTYFNDSCKNKRYWNVGDLTSKYDKIKSKVDDWSPLHCPRINQDNTWDSYKEKCDLETDAHHSVYNTFKRAIDHTNQNTPFNYNYPITKEGCKKYITDCQYNNVPITTLKSPMFDSELRVITPTLDCKKWLNF